MQLDRIASCHFEQQAVRRCMHTWLRELERSQMMAFALAAVGHFLAQHALKKWRLHAAMRGPIRIVLSIALDAWCSSMATAMRVSLLTWRVHCAWAHRARCIQTALAEGRALHSWAAFTRQRRRVHQLMGTFKGTRRAFFRRWRAHTRRPPLQPLGAPSHLHLIRSMTWRECCTWLGSEGIRVSHSPPVLLRALRTGAPYKELVRRIAPPFWVRHKLARVHEPRMIFGLIQQLFDTESFVHKLGCHNLDVSDLVGGKALAHLELLAAMREGLELALEKDDKDDKDEDKVLLLVNKSDKGLTPPPLVPINMTRPAADPVRLDVLTRYRVMRMRIGQFNFLD